MFSEAGEESATESLLRFLGATTASNDRNTVAFFHAAIDGSGSPSKHTAVSYAGISASSKHWDAFAEDWVVLLRKNGLKYFKMAEAMTWWGEFASKFSEWGENRDVVRDELLRALAALSVQYGFQPVGVTAESNVWLSTHGAGWKTELLKGALSGVLDKIPSEHYITIAIDDDDVAVEGNIRAWINEARKSSAGPTPNLAGICFLNDRIYPSLQLADMVAWLFRAWGEARIASGNAREPAPPLLVLMLGNRLDDVRIASPGGLLKAIEDINKESLR